MASHDLKANSAIVVLGGTHLDVLTKVTRFAILEEFALKFLSLGRGVSDSPRFPRGKVVKSASFALLDLDLRLRKYVSEGTAVSLFQKEI